MAWKRFVTMHESPYHGLNFCQGTVAEMLDDPGREIDDVIRWFGHAGQAVQRAFPQYPRAQARLHGGVSGRRRHGHGALAAGSTTRLAICYMLMPDHVPRDRRP